MDAGEEGGGGGIVGAVSNDRGGGGGVWERTGGEGFLQEAVLLVSAMGLSEEGATADGGQSRSSGAGGVKKRGLLVALQAERLRRGEGGAFVDNTISCEPHS